MEATTKEASMAKVALYDARGPLQQLLDVLAGEEGGWWLGALNRFLRKEDPWVAPLISREITVGGCVYEVLPLLRGRETSVPCSVMFGRVWELQACLNWNDRKHLVANYDEVPAALQDRLIFACMERRPDGTEGMVATHRSGDGWVSYSDQPDSHQYQFRNFWVIRRNRTRA